MHRIPEFFRYRVFPSSFSSMCSNPGLARINRDLIDRGPRPVTLPAANIPKTNVWSIQQSENEA